jgi:hypothetical protein
VRHLVILSLLLLGLVGCGAKEISAVRCKACSGEPYSTDDCEGWAAAAGCESWELLSFVDGPCKNACRFENCDRIPECGTMGPPQDASVPRPDVDLCQRNSNGLFSSCDVCPGSCKEIKVKSVRGKACTCDEPCPCGLTCGTLTVAGEKFDNICN